MTKRNQKIVNSFYNSNVQELRQVYTKCSKDKAKAFEDCRKKMVENDGERFRIITANRHMFTAGFLFTDSDNNKCLMYITKSGDTIIVLE